jgi:hypothetical protein
MSTKYWTVTDAINAARSGTIYAKDQPTYSMLSSTWMQDWGNMYSNSFFFPYLPGMSEGWGTSSDQNGTARISEGQSDDQCKEQFRGELRQHEMVGNSVNVEQSADGEGGNNQQRGILSSRLKILGSML